MSVSQWKFKSLPKRCCEGTKHIVWHTLKQYNPQFSHFKGNREFVCYSYVTARHSATRMYMEVHVCCLHLKMESCSCARGRQWCGIIHYHWWTASINRGCCFPVQAMLPEGFPFHQFIIWNPGSCLCGCTPGCATYMDE